MSQERFWFEEPGDLVRRLNLLARKDDTLDQKLNALTRLLIVLVIVLALLKWKHWEWLLLIGIAFILYFHLSRERECLVENFNEDMSSASFKYYSQVPLEQLYTYEIGSAVPVVESSSEVSHAPEEVTSSAPVQVESRVPIASEKVEPPVPSRAHEKSKKHRGGWSSPNPKNVSPSENEQRSYDFLREKIVTLDETTRRNALKSLF